ncbi:MAG: heparinase II/III family protein, partial [Bryobacteraceae bacterium]
HAGWAGVLPVFLESPSFDDAFLNKVFTSISAQADFLSHHLTAFGNWRISQLDALVFTAVRFPFLENAPRLREAGIAGMRAALATQLLPDGVHIERAPGYASWMTSVAANYYLLPKLFPDADARVDAARLLGALDYGAQCELSGLNDSTAPHTDPKELEGFRRRTEAISRLNLKAPKEPPLAQVFPNAGQVFLRSAWKPGADYIAFDASSWGRGHSHLSRLSFAFRSGGRMLVADPGILNYEMSDPLAPYGKSTPAHSTLNIGGLNQSGADAQLLRTQFSPDLDLIHARYQGGYWEGRYTWSFGKGRGAGTYGSHERILLWIKGEYILVLDSMDADPGADIRNCWQLGPVERWSHDPAALAWWSENRDTNLLLQLVAAPSGAAMQIFEGSKEPPRGWVGFHGNDAVPAPLVEFRYAGAGRPVTSVALLASYTGTNKPSFRTTARLEAAAIRRLDIGLPNGSTDHFAWSDGLVLPIDDGEPFTTDGTLAWVRTDAAGKPAKWFTLGGRYLTYEGQARIARR